MDNGLTHFDKSGNARMVDVSEKKETARCAIAVSKIVVWIYYSKKSRDE